MVNDGGGKEECVTCHEAPIVTLLLSWRGRPNRAIVCKAVYFKFNTKRCVEPSLFCDTVSIVNHMCRHSPFGECDAVGISSVLGEGEGEDFRGISHVPL
jgi:hypothetical protein